MPSTKSSFNIEIGKSLGLYKILQQLGEGGFGFVFLAEQSEPVRRKVALKILKLGMDTHQVIARFEAERQALAMMDHPNIAKVLDAGATETGRPYFVMELVKGIPITQYCDENRLTPKERLVLFMLVCNAVQHAHTKGIIHRDLKPSNILITMQDGKPVPKVIDFGIAKAIDQKLTEKTVFTEFHQLIGTPEYMSPEQAEMSGIDIDTRSDVYSLGVLLYELLTGTTPFDPQELRNAGYGEIQRIIREVDPPKPSTRMTELIVTSRGQRHADAATPGTWNQNPVDLKVKIEAAIAGEGSAAGIARNRRSEPGGLCKLLKGDLDWITMKALEKDRTRRYETASALEMEILRYLCDEPITASPPDLQYRLRKFIRRNRRLVASIILVVTALLAGLLSTSVFAWREHQARLAAERDRSAAESDRQSAVIAKTNLLVAMAPMQKLVAGRSGGSADQRGLLRRCLDTYAQAGHAHDPPAAMAWFLLGTEERDHGNMPAAIECFVQARNDLAALPSHRLRDLVFPDLAEFMSADDPGDTRLPRRWTLGGLFREIDAELKAARKEHPTSQP